MAKRRLLVIGIVLGMGGFLLCMPMVFIYVTTRGERFDVSQINDMPHHRVGLVFGAGIMPDGTPTPYLENRIRTGVLLYKANKVDKLLMSGDNSTEHHNEPIVMKRHAVKLGVPAEDIAMDFAGFNTYDSCYRAKHIFGLKDVAVITQGYHLPRAVTTCQGVGLQTDGMKAVRKGRDFTASYVAREVLSTDKMVLQLITDPQPTILGESEDL